MDYTTLAEELLIENGVKPPFKIVLPRQVKHKKPSVISEIKKLDART